MAVANVKEFTHLSDEDVEAIGREFDALRKEIEESLGDDDANYIRSLIKFQRRLAVVARATLFASVFPPAWVAGTGMLALAKILENMEIGHNIMHAQWDWMNDPEIHSSTWEWDTLQPAEQWKHSHNYIHHHFTNVLGKDKDVGYEILRVTRDQKWSPGNLGQPVYNFLLAMLFQWGVALHDLDIEAIQAGEKDPEEMKRQLAEIFRKVRKQLAKDYLLFPALAGPFFPFVLSANLTANWIRNMWAYTIIFCNHFPDGAVKFTEEELENETQAEWYLRQLLGAANFTGSRLLHILSGNLGYQIEHHLYPDLPSNRYEEISYRVKDIARRYNLPYTVGPLWRQYGQTLRTILKLSLPNQLVFGKPEPETGPGTKSLDEARKARESSKGEARNQPSPNREEMPSTT